MKKTQPDIGDCDKSPAIIKPETVDESSGLLVQITAAKVTDDASYGILEGYLVANKKLQKKISEHFGPHKKRAHEMHAALCKDEKKYLTPLQAGERAGKAKLGVYAAYVAAQAKIEQARLDKIAKVAAEKERKRLLAIAERAEAAGKAEKAEAALEAAQEVDEEDFVPAAPPRQVWSPTSSGRKANWQATVFDFHALVKAAATDKSLLQFLLPNSKYLGQRAKSDKGNLKVPGVRVKDVGSMSIRSK